MSNADFIIRSTTIAPPQVSQTATFRLNPGARLGTKRTLFTRAFSEHVSSIFIVICIVLGLKFRVSNADFVAIGDDADLLQPGWYPPSLLSSALDFFRLIFL